MTKLSIELEQYFSQKKLSDDIRLVDLLELAGKRVFGFLFVILSLPSALPVPAPGYSIPFGKAEVKREGEDRWRIEKDNVE